MKEILDKLSSYNIFNYFFPGVLFAVIVGKITPYVLIQEDLLVGAFVYYFLGMIVSRFGSIVIEPILKFTVAIKSKKRAFIYFTDYKQFISAEKLDKKIELLSEVNNTYRTLLSMFTLLLILKIYSIFAKNQEITQDTSNIVAIVLLLVLFAISYRKQTKYVKGRCDAVNAESQNSTLIIK